MFTRRIFLSSTLALATTVAGCDSSRDWPSASATWRGKSIDVYAGDGVSLNWQEDRAEIEVGGHQIVVRETAITVNGATKDVQAFKRVVIHVKLASVTVTVDGTMLFT